MSKVTRSIGDKFERYLQQEFPELEFTGNNLNVPDFHNPNGFWVEAKIGNQRWGPRIKDYQIISFKGLEERTVYALGMHSLPNMYLRLRQKTEKGRQEFLERNMAIQEIYWVSRDIIEAIWKMDGRLSAKNGSSYCCVKSSILRNILRNREFKRNGNSVASPESFYGYNQRDFLMQEPKDNPNPQACEHGAILHLVKDTEAIEFLQRYKKI